MRTRGIRWSCVFPRIRGLGWHGSQVLGKALGWGITRIRDLEQGGSSQVELYNSCRQDISTHIPALQVCCQHDYHHWWCWMQVLVTPALCFLTTLQCVDRVESAMIIPAHHSCILLNSLTVCSGNQTLLRLIIKKQASNKQQQLSHKRDHTNWKHSK